MVDCVAINTTSSLLEEEIIEPHRPGRRGMRLRWFRVSRTGSQQLRAEWSWADKALAQRRLRDCHVMFVRSSAGAPVHIRRVPLQPAWREDCQAEDLSPDATYRVCLQCSGRIEEANSTTTSATATSTGVPPMYCADASTGLSHVSAGAGSAVGALLALLAVLLLLLASRRARRCRKANDRQSSAKRLLQDASSPTGGNSPPRRVTMTSATAAAAAAAAAVGGASSASSEDEAYCGDVGGCGSGDRSTTTPSDQTMTPPPLTPSLPQLPSPPPPPPPPPPPLATPSLCETDDDASVLSPLLPEPRADASAILDLQPAGDSLIKRVIRVNGTDDYSIDLRLCDALMDSRETKSAAPLFTQLIETL